jgi:hypothetical protein
MDAQRRNIPAAAYGRTSRMSGPDAPFSSVSDFPAGMEGAQNGTPQPRVSVAPGMGSMANAGPFTPAMEGTQGGGVDESPTMQGERMLQYLLSMGLVVPGTIGGGSFGGLPGAMAGGVAAGMPGMVNSSEPNIRDVWFDKLRMMKQGN